MRVPTIAVARCRAARDASALRDAVRDGPLPLPVAALLASCLTLAIAALRPAPAGCRPDEPSVVIPSA